MKPKDYDLGVIIGRYQEPELHESDKFLFDTLGANHGKVLCVLGLAPTKSTMRNPLDFVQRKTMINEIYPDVVCLYIKDVMNDALWSRNLDELIQDQLMPNQKALLYGSRDSFISYYNGRFATHELESTSFISGA